MAAPLCISAAQAHELASKLANAAETLVKDTLTYGSSVELKISVSAGDFKLDVDNSAVPDLAPAPPPAPVKRRKTEGEVLCHEAGQKKYKAADCVKCTKCGKLFNVSCVESKFKDSVVAIRADPNFTCWHCRGVCGLHTCVKKREGGLTAGEVESNVGNGKTYFEMITEAKAAGCDSVQAHLKKIGSDKAW